MNADEVTRILAQSSQNDWIVDDETGAFTYKNDLALHIKRADYDDYNSLMSLGLFVILIVMRVQSSTPFTMVLRLLIEKPWFPSMVIVQPCLCLHPQRI